MYERLVEALRKEALEAPGLSPNGYTLMREAADFIDDLVSALNHADEQIASLVEAAEKRKWVSVRERLPEDGVYVLGRYKNNDMAVVCVFEHDEEFDFWRAMVDEGWETDCDAPPTHWMQLPEAPKEDEE